MRRDNILSEIKIEEEGRQRSAIDRFARNIMPELVNRITIFVASPADTAQERGAVKDTIEQLNQNAMLGESTIVQLKGWETHTWPGFGEDAQAVINEQIGPYDIFVGIMWNRVGTPTGRAISGTIEEFDQACAAWKTHKRPSIMFYFNRAPSDLGTQSELQQKMEVLTFKKAVNSLGALYCEYNGIDEFRKVFLGHLINELRKHITQKQILPTTGGPELFTDPAHWPHLLKIGAWHFDPNTGVIRGGGVYEFLLSRHIYGSRNFTIKSTLKFGNYRRFSQSGIDTANTGIILGWQENSRGHQYYNLLFTGQRLLLEAVGWEGADDYGDFKHLDEGVALELDEARFYELGISVTDSAIKVFIDDVKYYSVSSPLGLQGRVGLRPWRADLICSKFIVTDS
jgi:hypothetical protein